MTPILAQLDNALTKAERKRQKALRIQRENRQQARDRGIPVKVTHIAAWTGGGSSGCLSLIVDGRISTLIWNCKVVYRQRYGHNIQVYCPGDWEAVLSEWHRKLQLEVTVKQARLDGIRSTTKAIEAATTCKIR